MSKTTQPSPVYVFVVLSLAAFLTLFTFCRKPGIVYRTEVLFRQALQSSEVADSKAGTAAIEKTLEQQLLDPEFVLSAMRRGEMIRGATTPETLAIAASIAKRMNVHAHAAQGETLLRLSLITERPKAGLRLLDAMSQQFSAETTGPMANAEIRSFPATIADRRGGTIDSLSWFLLSIASACVGVFGLVLRDRAEKPSLLISNEQAEQVLPVVADFSDDAHEELAGTREVVAEEQLVRSRTLTAVLRVAEVAVAAAFLLMVFHLATKDTLLDRFVSDPLAAYGEVLTYVIG